MNLHFGFSVFELVGQSFRLPWQLPSLADRDEPDSEPIGNRCPEEKSARIDAYDFPDVLIDAIGHQAIDGRAEESAVAEDGSDILEEDSWPWKIWHIPHRRAQRFGRCH
jgi:hypothetical protein